MAIQWDDIRLLQALDRIEDEQRAIDIDGLQLMLTVAGAERCEDLDRVSFTRLLYTLSEQGRLSFEIKDDPGVVVPSAEDPRHLEWLWRFKLTETGRGRRRARVVVERRPDTDEDDGRPIPGLALDRFGEAIAAWYTPAQLSRFLHDSGLPRIRSVQPLGSTEDLSANLAAYAQGNREQRRELRRFLAAFLSGDLDPVPDGDQREELIATLAMAGWHLRDDILVAGERVIPPAPRAATARTVATALELGAIARAGETERERDLAFEQARVSELARQAAEQQLEHTRENAERAEQQAAAHAWRAERAESRLGDAVERAEGAESQLRDAVERAERAEQRARSERAELERELGEQREARVAVELERDQARAALEAEQRLRAQLQADLETAQQRLEAAEKARDDAIAAGTRPAIRRGTSRRKT